MTDAHGPSRWWQRWLSPPVRPARSLPRPKVTDPAPPADRPQRRLPLPAAAESHPAFLDTDFAWAYRLDDEPTAPDTRPAQARRVK